MTIAVRQVATGTGAGTGDGFGSPTQATFASPVLAGSCIVVLVYQTFGVTNVLLGTNVGGGDGFVSASDTFTHVTGASEGTDSDTVDAYVDPNCSGGWYAVAASNNGVGTSATNPLHIAAYEVTGVSSQLSVTDVTHTGSNGTGTTSWSSGTSSATVFNDELVVGMVGSDAAATITGPSSPWVNTSLMTTASSNGSIAGYKVVSATGTQVYSGTFSSSRRYAAVVLSLKPDYADPSQQFPANVLGLSYELLLNGTWTDITQFVYQRDAQLITGGRPNEGATQPQPVQMALTLDNRGGDFSPKNSSGQFYPYIGRNTQLRVKVAAGSSSSVGYSGYRFYGEVSEWPPQWDVTGTDVYVQVTASGVLRRYLQGKTLGSALRRFYMLKTDATTPVAYWPCEELTGAAQFANLITPGDDITWTGTPTLSSDSAFSGSDPLPLVSGSTWTGVTGLYSSAGPATFSTPGTYLWTAPGGVTSLTSAECWAGGGGATNGYAVNSGESAAGGGAEYAKETSVAVTPGNTYTVVVGAGGKGGALSTGGFSKETQNPGANGGNSTFQGDSVTVVAHGGGGGNFQGYPNGQGAGGTGSTNTTHFSGGHGGQSHTGTLFGGSGGGSSAGTAANGNNGTDGGASNTGASGGAAVTGGGAGGKGGNGGAGVDQAGFAGAAPGGGGGAGGENSNNQAAHSGGNGGAGKVVLSYTSTTTPNNLVVRFLLDIPSNSTPADATVLLRTVIASGGLDKVECYYSTASGGKLSIKGSLSGVTKFDSAGSGITNVAGKQLMVSLEIAKSGSNIAWKIDTIQPGAGSSYGSASGTYSTATMGAASQVVVAPSGGVNDTAIGHVVVQYALEALTAVSDAINGHDGELAGNRFTRLGNELGITATLVGNASDTPQMGPQRDLKLTDLLQEIETADQGVVYEPRDSFGLAYRTRVNLQNQSVAVTLNYANAVLAGELRPAPDDQLVRNDIAVSRPNGSTATTSLASGALSTLDPPNGVGDYPYPLSANVHADSQLANLADWVLTTGTVDQYRYPQVTVDLARSQAAVIGIFDALPAMRIGDYFQITNPPSWVPESPVKQLMWGYTETLNNFTWTITMNAIPESPYEGVGLPTW